MSVLLYLINIFHLHALSGNFNIFPSHPVFSQGNLDYRDLTEKKKSINKFSKACKKRNLFCIRIKVNSVFLVNHCQLNSYENCYFPQVWQKPEYKCFNTYMLSMKSKPCSNTSFNNLIYFITTLSPWFSQRPNIITWSEYLLKY